MAKSQLRIGGDRAKAIPLRVPFTKHALDAIKAPAGKDRIWVFDAERPALAFMRTARGASSFYFCRRVRGRPTRIRIGAYPEISIEGARKAAQRLSHDIASGIDPLAGRRADRDSQTLGQVFDRWLEEHAARLRPSTLKTDRSRFKLLDDWKKRRIVDLTAEDIKARHSSLGKSTGHTSANRAIELLRRVLNWADLLPRITAKVDWFPERERERFLQPSEVPRLFAAIDAEKNEVVRDFLLMTLWTGGRRSNVQAMAWKDIDLAGKTWSVPGSQMKSHARLTAHLSAPAVDILSRRKNASKLESPWVFPSDSASGHIVEPHSTWERICLAAGITDLHIHDLRRSLGSWMAAAGTSLPVIGRQLGHANVRTTAIYARVNIDPVRDAVEGAARALKKAGKSNGVVAPREGGDKGDGRDDDDDDGDH